MNSIVYFSNLEAHSNKDNALAKTAKLFETLYKKKQFFKPRNFVGIKAHFGEYGLTTYLKPVFARTIIETVKENGGNPFLFDTSVLYTNGKRTNAPDHLTTAIKNGFSYATMGAPIVIADGLIGSNEIEIGPIGQNSRMVKLASDIQYMDAIICLSHFKGHCVAGFGGAIKNISMGMTSRAGKLDIHSATKPFATSKCTACGTCVKICPVSAVSINDYKAKINPNVCIGCMHCDVKCPASAIKFNWDSPEQILMGKMAEYAAGFTKLKGENTIYLNFLMDITKDCDCYGFSNSAKVEDIGILASFDPLAIDQASLDLVNKTAGHDVFRKIWPKTNYEYLLQYCAELGIGQRQYTLEKIKI